MRTRYEQKKDQHGKQLSDSVAMNSLDQLVLKGLEDHLLLNQSRLKTFAAYELEVRTYIEAKHGGKVKITIDFPKDAGGPQPMDVGSLSVFFDLAASTKGKGFTLAYSDKSCFTYGKAGHLSQYCRKGKGKGGKDGEKSGKGDDRKCFNCRGNHLKMD